MPAVIELLGSRHQYACQLGRPHRSAFGVPAKHLPPVLSCGLAAVQGRHFRCCVQSPAKGAAPIDRAEGSPGAWPLHRATSPGRIGMRSARADQVRICGGNVAFFSPILSRNLCIPGEAGPGVGQSCSKDKTLGVDEAARCTAGLACRPHFVEKMDNAVLRWILGSRIDARAAATHSVTRRVWPVTIVIRFAERSFAR
jgi:hypothetical protein